MKNDSNIKPNAQAGAAPDGQIPEQAMRKVLSVKSGCIFIAALLLLVGCETYKTIPGHPNGMSLGVSYDPNGSNPQIYETLNWNFD